MPKLDLIIPALNEAEHLPALFSRIHNALSDARVSYRIIFVDDHSTDSTSSVIARLATQYPLLYHLKVGSPGKAFSIIEGTALVKAPFVGMIDADLEYPPEIIPQMLNLLTDHGLVVANRTTSHSSIFRKFLSRSYRLIFGRLLLGFNFDVQSGLKLFRREIISALEPDQIKAWAIDVPLLQATRDLGFSIGSVNITYTPRAAQESKCRRQIFKAIREIALSAIRIRFTPHRIIPIPAVTSANMLGAGVVYRGRRFVTHSTLSLKYSALTTFQTWQKLILFGILETFVAGIFIVPVTTITILVGILSALYFCDMVFSFLLIYRSLRHTPELSFTVDQLQALDPASLPMYTILCPLYKEAKVLPQFISSIQSLDWPKDRLEVLLLMEADDKTTQEAAQLLNLPDYIKVIVVPPSQPKTKPKACNYGLNIAKGNFLVIYDAEDRPDSDQLKKAYLGFLHLPDEVICLQAKLNYFNSNQNLLTRLFTAEYSLWFDVVLPGYQSINTTIPLGGTSNHFRTPALHRLCGWDAFNVTEDCDLGARLFKSGFRTALIDSTTLEEANSSLPNWIRQRSRWIKGYLQTFLVHNRHPLQFIKSMGWHAFIFQLIVGGKTAFAIINPLLWLATFSYFAFYKFIGPTIESVYPAPVFYLAGLSAIFGNFLFLYYYMIGLAKRNRWDLVKYVFFIPFYWVMVSVAAFKAVYQLFFRPHYWEKTHHGLVGTKLSIFRLPSLSLPKISWTISFTFPKYSPSRRLSQILLVTFWMAFQITLLSRIWDNGIFSLIAVVVTAIGYPLSVKVLLFRATSKKAKSSPQLSRILIYNWRDNRHVWAGGAEVYLHELARRWVAMGHQVTLFCGNDGHSSSTEIIDGVKIIRKGGFYTVYIWAAIYYLLRLRGHYDVIIDSENGIPFFSPLFSRLPVYLLIYHVHQEYFRTHVPFPLSAIAAFLESRLMPLIYRRNQVLTISASSQSDILALGHWPENKISIVYPGVNLSQFSLSPKTTEPSFIYLGRIKPYKNVDIAIRAFSQVLKAYPTATLTIAGWGENLSQLKRLTSTLHLQKSVNFLGRIAEEDKNKLLGSHWLMLQPSSLEGWGITVIEANASGTPVIASDVSGLKDSVINGQTGLLVPPRDADSLAQTIITLLNNPPRLRQLGLQAQIYAQNFSWDDKAEEFIRIIYSGQKLLPTGTYQPIYG